MYFRAQEAHLLEPETGQQTRRHLTYDTWNVQTMHDLKGSIRLLMACSTAASLARRLARHLQLLSIKAQDATFDEV